MKTKYITWVIAIAVIFFIVAKPIAADDPNEEQKTISTVESLLQSTVIIKTAVSEGSGFYISDNEIITNAHVIGDQTTVFIKKSNGQSCLAELVFKQTKPDLALLKASCDGKPIKLADSVKIGQSVLSMGNPMYREFMVSKGIVGLHESGEIIHDAVIDKGSSGGPVVNLNGELVGVTYASSTAVPKMSFAIDIKTLSYFLYQARGE